MDCMLAADRWNDLASRVLDGHQLTVDEGLSILQSDDDDLLDLLAATYRVRRKHFGKQVHLYFLKNAKSGLCPEDCGYCSQSIVSEAEISPFIRSPSLRQRRRKAAGPPARHWWRRKRGGCSPTALYQDLGSTRIFPDRHTDD